MSRGFEARVDHLWGRMVTAHAMAAYFDWLATIYAWAIGLGQTVIMLSAGGSFMLAVASEESGSSALPWFTGVAAVVSVAMLALDVRQSRERASSLVMPWNLQASAATDLWMRMLDQKPIEGELKRLEANEADLATKESGLATFDFLTKPFYVKAKDSTLAYLRSTS